MSKEVSMNDVHHALQENKTLAESSANFELLEEAIKLERKNNGEETHTMSLLQNLRSFQMKRLLANLVKPD